MKNQMRFSTLSRDFGPLFHAKFMSKEAWDKAWKEGRFMTVYHSESDWRTPVFGLVRHDGFVNTICKVAFSKVLPKGIEQIVGMRDSDEAFKLCNSENNIQTL